MEEENLRVLLILIPISDPHHVCVSDEPVNITELVSAV